METEEGGRPEVPETRVTVSWKSTVGSDVYWPVHDWFVSARKQTGAAAVGLESWPRRWISKMLSLSLSRG